MAHIAILAACAAVAAYQLVRVPRAWAFLLLFMPLAPKVPLAAVPGNTTPIRVDDLVVAVVLMAWIARRFFAIGQVRLPARRSSADQDRSAGGKPDATYQGEHAAVPPSPVTLFLLLYGYAAAVCTLIGIAALTTAPLTGVLHVGRLVEYGLLYYFFYSSIDATDPRELGDFVEVLRTSLLLVCGIWLVQHWTHAPVGAPTPWATLYPTFSATYDFGGYLMLSTGLLYALWATGASRTAWTTIALTSGAFVIVNSDSRASLVGFALIVAIDLVVRLRWRAAIAIAAIALTVPYVVRSKKMAALFAGVTAVVTSFSVGAIQRAMLADPSLALRFRNWRLAIDHWLARPFFGEGLGGYLSYVRQYDQPASPDGWYVRLLADSGVVGFVAFVLLIGALLVVLVRRARAETDPLRHAIVYGAALAVVAASVSAVLVDTFVSYKIMGMFWTLVACGTRVAAAGTEHA
jgi:O-antigen ligase